MYSGLDLQNSADIRAREDFPRVTSPPSLARISFHTNELVKTNYDNKRPPHLMITNGRYHPCEYRRRSFAIRSEQLHFSSLAHNTRAPNGVSLKSCTILCAIKYANSLVTQIHLIVATPHNTNFLNAERERSEKVPERQAVALAIIIRVLSKEFDGNFRLASLSSWREV